MYNAKFKFSTGIRKQMDLPLGIKWFEKNYFEVKNCKDDDIQVLNVNLVRWTGPVATIGTFQIQLYAVDILLPYFSEFKRLIA